MQLHQSMTFNTALRLNATGLQPDPRDEAKRSGAALDAAAPTSTRTASTPWHWKSITAPGMAGCPVR
ncbi:MAG: hypothetical protein IPF57_11840 [Gammaproteobacteria bacterium]|nr:hypothetical protein [Gammaproteobacteria bacterium]